MFVVVNVNSDHLENQVNKDNDDADPKLQLELGPPPVVALWAVSDCVAGSRQDPLRDQPVLLQVRGELHLDAEGLVGRHFENVFLLLWLAGKETHLHIFMVAELMIKHQFLSSGLQ